MGGYVDGNERDHLFDVLFERLYFVCAVAARRCGGGVGAARWGVTTSLSSNRYFFYNNHINLGDWFWLPASILLWQQLVRGAEQGRWVKTLTWGAVLGLAVWGIGHTDLQFPIFVAFWLVPYGLWTLWKVIRDIALNRLLASANAIRH